MYANEAASLSEKDLEKLVQASALDSDTWSQDHRDAALVCAKVILDANKDTRQLDQQRLFKSYAQTVRQLEPESDYFGAPHSVYEMGEALAAGLGSSMDPTVPYHTKMIVRAAWAGFFTRVPSHKLRSEGQERIEHLIKAILPPTDRRHSEWEWARQRPPMDERSSYLHDFYFQEVRTNKSFIPYLYRHTPRFQEKAAEKGVDVAGFWNLTNPSAIEAGLVALAGDPDLTKAIPLLNEQLDCYGVTVTDLLADTGLCRAMSDQVQQAMSAVAVELGAREYAPEELHSRLRQQVVGALQARKPNRKLAPVRNFLAENGLQSDGTAEELLARLDEPVTKQRIFNSLQTKATLNSRLQQLFPGHPYTHLEFAKREEDDLYSADGTRDCTAYHLKNGFNAWTLAHWHTNPGFQMAYINYAGRPLAKVGMVLAEDQNGARVTVDSIETYKDLPNPGLALVHINVGILEISRWAAANNLGEVFFNPHSNSSELAMELPIKANEARPETLKVLGGNTGINEIWRASQAPYEGDIGVGYLQSRMESDDEDEAHQERQQAMLDLEDYISHTKEERIFEAARSGDTNELITTFVEHTMPYMHRLFGKNVSLYTDYNKYTDQFEDIVTHQAAELEEVNHALQGISSYETIVGATSLEGKDLKWLRKHIRVHEFELLENPKILDKLHYEAIRLDVLSARLQEVAKHMPVAKALSEIFGLNADSKPTNNQILLRRALPVIDLQVLLDMETDLKRNS